MSVYFYFKSECIIKIEAISDKIEAISEVIKVENRRTPSAQEIIQRQSELLSSIQGRLKSASEKPFGDLFQTWANNQLGKSFRDETDLKYESLEKVIPNIEAMWSLLYAREDSLEKINNFLATAKKVAESKETEPNPNKELYLNFIEFCRKKITAVLEGTISFEVAKNDIESCWKKIENQIHFLNEKKKDLRSGTFVSPQFRDMQSNLSELFIKNYYKAFQSLEDIETKDIEKKDLEKNAALQEFFKNTMIIFNEVLIEMTSLPQKFHPLYNQFLQKILQYFHESLANPNSLSLKIINEFREELNSNVIYFKDPFKTDIFLQSDFEEPRGAIQKACTIYIKHLIDSSKSKPSEEKSWPPLLEDFINFIKFNSALRELPNEYGNFRFDMILPIHNFLMYLEANYSTPKGSFATDQLTKSFYDYKTLLDKSYETLKNQLVRESKARDDAKREAPLSRSVVIKSDDNPSRFFSMPKSNLPEVLRKINEVRCSLDRLMNAILHENIAHATPSLNRRH